MTRKKGPSKEEVISETERVQVIRVKPRYRAAGDVVVLKNKRTGFYTAWNGDELFDLAELLDQLCDDIEDGVQEDL